ncbi:MAG TPA: hypothetical protein VNX65_04960 [Patescibacteria group bacterium]|jgi:hypothetical protein|nr:hypothetical protein [Patescibacteria group bacterium]
MATLVEASIFDPFEYYDDYVRSDEGKHQAGQPLRYGEFEYDRDEMLNDLGPDVHPVRHGLATHVSLLAVLAIGDIELSPFDHRTARLASLIHDMGEGTHPSFHRKGIKVVGDIPQGKKTETQRQDEAQVRGALYESYFSNLPDSVMERVEALVSHRVDGSDPAHTVIETAHNTNTLTAGLKAGAIVLREREIDSKQASNKRLEQLTRLAKTVTTGILKQVEHHSNESAYARRALEEAEPLYHRIHSEL